MKLRCEFLYPFDLGLELDFEGEDATRMFKEIRSREEKNLQFEGQVFPGAVITSWIYRFGVGLIRVAFDLQGDLVDCAHLSCSGEAIKIGKTGIIPYCAALSEGVIRRAEAYATHRYDRRYEQPDLYPVFILKEPLAEEGAQFVTRHQKTLFGLVVGEPEYARLSPFVLDEARLQNYGYYEEEVILVQRFGAFVSSSDERTVVDLIQLLYAQRWVLRSYNFVLDGELSEAQRVLDHVPPYTRVLSTFRAYHRFSTEALDFDKDKLAIVDSLYNAVGNLPQIESDWYLRTVYHRLKPVFELDELHRTVELKIDRLEASYSNAREFLSTNFFILLDIIFFLSLAWSIADTVLLWKVAHR